MFNLSQKSLSIFEKTQFLLISLLIVTLPYNIIAPRFSLLLSVLIFITAIINPKRSIKNLLQHKTILTLFAFILLTYISVLWTPSKDMFGGNFKVNIYAYLNYFFLIPGIYFAQLNRKKIKLLFYLLVLSPLIYVIIYYGNYFNLLHVYSIAYGGNIPQLYVDLFGNIFLLFSSVFIYIKLIEKILQKQYKSSFYFFILFLFLSLTLFIEELTSSRLINLSYFFSLIIVSLYYLSKKQRYIIGLLAIPIIGIFLSTASNYTLGFSELKKIYTTNEYSGSWGQRTNVLVAGVQIWEEDPYIGRGITDVIIHMKEFIKHHPKRFSETYVIHFHNQHVLILVQIGILGYLLFSIFMFYYYRLKIKNKEIHIYKNITIFIYMFLMWGEHYLQMIHTSTLFALLFSLFLVYHEEESL